MIKIITGLFSIFLLSAGFQEISDPNVLLPIAVSNRGSTNDLKLTSIGDFGLIRKARPKIAEHYHTGIDIQRPKANYIDEPVFPMASGVVISKREDGPYAQLIIEHRWQGAYIWTVYEHIAGINVALHDEVDLHEPIARFMNKNELETHGWQFDHFHFEILRKAPIQLSPSKENPDRRFRSHTLECHTLEQLGKSFFDPIEFFTLRQND